MRGERASRRVLLALTLVMACGGAWALDYPHMTAGCIGTDGCHALHGSAGGSLLTEAGNANVCQRCHADTFSASDTSLLDADKARTDPTDGRIGTSHAWGVVTQNATYVADAPTDAEMRIRLDDIDNTPGDYTDDLITCSTCHDQHNSTAGFPFLRKGNADSALCTECHDNTGTKFDPANYPHTATRTYDSSGSSFRWPDNLRIDDNGTPANFTDDKLQCLSCHAIHFASSGQNYARTASAGTTTSLTDNGVAAATGAAAGWRVFFRSGNNAGRSRLVASVVANSIAWSDALTDPADGSDEPIVNNDEYSLQAPAGVSDQGTGKILRQSATAICKECHSFPSNSPHSQSTADGRDPQCVVCHPSLGDIHAIQVGGGDRNPPTYSNAVAGMISGPAPEGAIPTGWGGAMNPPSGYNKTTATKEYELCFLCHATYAGGPNPGDGGSAGANDVSKYFNPSNVTFHPVVNAQNNPYCNTNTMVAGWNAPDVSHDTMWCSDCHRTDSSGAPHGMASGEKLWASLTAVDDIKSGDWYTPLCVKCHKYSVYANNGDSNSRFDEHNRGNHQVGPSGNHLGGCLSCHYGGETSLSSVHGSNHSQGFITGYNMIGGSAWWASPGSKGPNGTCERANSDGNCGGHNAKGY